MAALQVDHSNPVHLSLQEILNAANRSAGTVRQLLAFAASRSSAPKSWI